MKSKSFKSLFSLVVAVMFLFTGASYSFADKVVSSEVPLGYQVIKTYSKFENAINHAKHPDFSVLDLSNGEEDFLATEIVSQDTYPVRELRNSFTNERITQYVTEFEVSATVPQSRSGNDNDTSGKVHSFITIYWNLYGTHKNYIGLDKISWRIEHKDDNVRTIVAKKKCVSKWTWFKRACSITK